MKTETFEGVINSAYGFKLDESIKFSGSFDAFELSDTYVDTALTYEPADLGDTISDVITLGDLYAMVNNKRKANARQKAMQAALDAAGVSKPVMDDSDSGKQIALKSMIKAMVATGTHTESQAQQVAETALGVKLK